MDETPIAGAESGVSPGDPTFRYVLVGVDTTPESVIAAAQARCLCSPDSYLEVLAVAETHLASHAGFIARRAADELIAATHEELEIVRKLVAPDSVRFVAGSIAEALVAEAKRQSATLVALGVPPHRRLAARLFGGPDLSLLGEAPCSVLVVRAGWGVRRPQRILVGIDGSPEAAAAEDAARILAARLRCELEPVIAIGGGPVDDALLQAERPDALLDPRPAIEALTNAAADSLVVVGSSLARSPGPVTTHVAHEAVSSVLVVRSHEQRNSDRGPDSSTQPMPAS